MTNRYTRLTDIEATPGTNPASGEQSYRIYENNHVFVPEYELQRTAESTPEPERKELIAYMSSGNIVMPVVLNTKFGRWLTMLCGADAVTTENTSVGRHVITFLKAISASVDWPSYTMIKGNDLEQFDYTLFGVNRMNWQQPKKGLAVVDFGTFSQKPDGGTTLTSLTDFSDQAYIGHKHLTTQTVNGVAVNFEGFNIEVEGPADPQQDGGDEDIRYIDVRPAQVRFSGTIRFLTDDDFDDFLAGTGRKIVIKYTGDDAIASSSPSTNYSIQFEIFKLKYEDADIRINRQERTVHVLSGVAEQDSSTGDYFKITLDDETTTAYD